MSILQDESAVATDGSSSQSSLPKIDLQTCQPDELAAWLLTHRFKDNAMDVASFVLMSISTLPNAEEISAQLLGGGGEEEDDEAMEEDESKADDAEDAKPSPAQPAPAAKPKNNLLQSILNSQPNPTFATTNTEIEVSCINPRGKFILSLHKNGMVFTNPKKRDEEQIPISSANVQSVVWFRKPEDYKKVKQINKNADSGKKSKQGVPGHMVLICLKEDKGGDDDAASNIAEVKFRNKHLKQVCFQLPSYPIDESNDQLTEEAWWNGLSSALLYPEDAANGAIIRVHATLDKADYLKGKAGGYMFKSEGESGSTSTTTGGMPFVGCYQGFNDGALFPLREGLLFFKPPMFVPRSKLASISCGRGSGGSRYVDMVVQLDVSSESGDEQEGKKKKKESDMFEFTNIHRDELNGLNDYIHKTLIPAMQMDADGTGNVAEANSGSDDNDSDDDEEAVAEVVDGDNDDQNTNDSDDEESENGKRLLRPSRAASKSAREITRAALKAPVAEEDDDSDDDSDAFEEGDGSDDSDDESLDSDESSEDEEFDEEKMNESDDEDSDEDTGAQKSKKARVE